MNHEVLNHPIKNPVKLIKKSIYFLLIILISSCNSGKYYANYRAGGKTKKSPETKSVNTAELKYDEEMINSTRMLSEMVNHDTTTISIMKPVENRIYTKNNILIENVDHPTINSTSKNQKQNKESSKNKIAERKTKKLNPLKSRNINWFALLLGLSIGSTIFVFTGGIWLALGIAIGTIGLVYLIEYFLFVRLIKGLINVVDDFIQTSRENDRSSRRSLQASDTIKEDLSSDFLMDEALAQAFASQFFNVLAILFGVISLTRPNFIWLAAPMYFAAGACVLVGIICFLVALVRYLNGDIDKRNKKYLWIWLVSFIVTSALALFVLLMIL